MKTWYLILSIALALQFSCDKEDPNAENQIPTVPVLVSPNNYSLLNTTTVAFSWEPSTDPEGEEILYNLQLSDEPDFTHIIFTDELLESSFQTELSPGEFYYWRVRAKDASNNTSDFSFRQNLVVADNSIENYPPFPPEKNFPELDEAIDIDQAELGWTAVDIDDTDLRYNIYLGTSFGDLPLYVENIATTEVTLNLDDAAVYYWQVEVIDPSGQAVKSPVWWFKST